MSNHDEVAYTEKLGTGKKTLTLYIIGFVLCVILTLIPFALVAKQLLSPQNIYITVVILAVVQLYVQVVFFLRLNASHHGRWNSLSFLFTLFIVVILVFGSLWIMYNLNYNMMH